METNSIDSIMDEALANPVFPYTFKIDQIGSDVYVSVYDTRKESIVAEGTYRVMCPDWIKLNILKWSLETMIKRKLNKVRKHYLNSWKNEIKAKEAVHNFKLNKEV